MLGKNQHENDGGRGLDVFQCCNPGTELDCWSALGTLFQRHINEGQAVESEIPPEETSITKGGESPRRAGKAVAEVESAPMIPVEEKEKLHRIFDIISNNSKIDDPRQKGVSLEDVNVDEKKCATVPLDEFSSSIFLLDLAKAAAKVALEDAERKIESENNKEQTDLNFSDNPEAAIQRLLQIAKQKEVIQQRYQQHLERVEFLLSDENNNFLDVLEPRWKSFAECLTKEEQKKEERYQDILPFLNILLGKSEMRDALQFLWKSLSDDDASPDHNHDESNSNSKRDKSIICMCFNCAVAHSFLTSQDAKHREEAKVLLMMGLISTNAKSERQQESSDSAIQYLLNSLSQYYDKHKTEGDISVGNNHGKLPPQALFLGWHDSTVPAMVFSLSIFMQDLLFPSFDDDLREISLFPALHNDKASKNLVFPNANGGSSWLYPISCIIPFKHHVEAGPSWPRLYSSLSEGFNPSTLDHSLVGYNGPTLLLVEAFDKDSRKTIVFGAFASQPWKKQSSSATDFYGDSDSFLFQIKPTFQVWRARQSPAFQGRQAASNYQYFNFDNRPGSTKRAAVSAKSNGERRYAEGLGLGGTKRRPRFFISATLDQCFFGSNDATFEGDNTVGEKISSSLEPLWDLHALEIWGLGGDAALRALSRHHSSEDERLQQARQVDKSAFLNDFRSGLLESKMFDFHQEMRNRDGGCLLECHNDDEDDGRWQIGKPG